MRVQSERVYQKCIDTGVIRLPEPPTNYIDAFAKNTSSYPDDYNTMAVESTECLDECCQDQDIGEEQSQLDQTLKNTSQKQDKPDSKSTQKERYSFLPYKTRDIVIVLMLAVVIFLLLTKVVNK